MKKTYDCNQLYLSHVRVVELRNSGKLNLGINNEFAARLTNEKGLGPSKTTVNIAFHFWNWAAFGGFAYTVYLSFTSNWWWFLIGIFGALFLFRMNKKGNADNYLDAAMVDEEFYDRVRNLKGWVYEIDEETYHEQLKD